MHSNLPAEKILPRGAPRQRHDPCGVPRETRHLFTRGRVIKHNYLGISSSSKKLSSRGECNSSYRFNQACIYILDNHSALLSASFVLS